MGDRKPIFEAVRKMLGRGFSDAEVKALDAACDAAGMARVHEVMPEPKGRTIGEVGIALIKSFEGCKLTAYPDPATGGDPWTIGWGTTGPDVKRGVVWSQDYADKRFAAHVAEFAERVAKMIGDAPTTQNQFDALVSLAYNIGTHAFAYSTLIRKHREGNFAGAASEFTRWNKANGKVMAGLTRRREAEAALYRGK